MYLCCHLPFLCSPPWFRDSMARFWYFVADHIDEFVMKPAQRAAVRKNVDYFLRRLQLLGLFVPLFLVPGELKLMRKKGWVLSSVKMALQAMRCKPAIACIVRHLRLSFGKRGVWADFINAKRICRDAVVQIDQRNEMRDSGAPAPGCGLCWTNCRRNFAMCGIAGRCVSMFPIECASKVGMHSSLVCCSPASLMLRLSGLLCSHRWNWLHLT